MYIMKATLAVYINDITINLTYSPVLGNSRMLWRVCWDFRCPKHLEGAIIQFNEPN